MYFFLLLLLLWECQTNALLSPANKRTCLKYIRVYCYHISAFANQGQVKWKMLVCFSRQNENMQIQEQCIHSITKTDFHKISLAEDHIILKDKSEERNCLQAIMYFFCSYFNFGSVRQMHCCPLQTRGHVLNISEYTVTTFLHLQNRDR